MRIVIVGIGFLGGAFADELVRYLDVNNADHEIILIDPDTVEERNIHSQVYWPSDVSLYKVDAVWTRLQGYKLRISTFADKVAPHHLDGADLVVDCVDNVEARRLMSEACQAKDIPLLHLGMSPGGTGSVEWDDTYSLKAANWPPQEDVKQPPCYLVGYRPLAFNVAQKGAVSAACFLGIDVLNRYGEECGGTQVSWRSINETDIIGKGDET